MREILIVQKFIRILHMATFGKDKQAESKDKENMPLSMFSRYSDNDALNETFITSDFHSL